MFQAYNVYIQDTSWQDYTQLSTMSFAHITPGSSASDSQLPKQILSRETLSSAQTKSYTNCNYHVVY